MKKSKNGKFDKLDKMETVQKKVIKKPEKPERPVPKQKKLKDANSAKRALDYLEQKRNQSSILPLSGPNIEQNYIQCKFYSNGKCKYGRNCRYSHNFVEKISINTLNLDNSNVQAQPMSFQRLHALNLPNELDISHMKTFTITYKDKRTKTFVAVVHMSKRLFVYSLDKHAPLCYFKFQNQEDLVDFEVFSTSSWKDNGLLHSTPTSCSACLLTIHINGRMKLWNLFQARCLKTYDFTPPHLASGRKHIYKVEKVNLAKQLIANLNQNIPKQTMNKLSNLKEISTWMVVHQSGTILFTEIKKGVFLCQICLGIRINDIAFITSKEVLKKSTKIFNDNNIEAFSCPKDKHIERMPSYAIVAGKGIHVWDLIAKKPVRILSYNSYAYYLAVTTFEVNEKSATRCLVAAIGKLHDSIISFGNEVFIEIWNPFTGGCIKRITRTNLKFSYDFNTFDNYFLTVFPFKASDEGSQMCLANTENKFELWDLFKEHKVSEIELPIGQKVSLEPFRSQDKSKFLLAAQDKKSRSLEFYVPENYL